MVPCCCHFEGSFYVLLTADVGKIDIIFIGFSPEQTLYIDFHRLKLPGAVVKINHVAKLFHAVDIESGDNSCLPGILYRHYHSFETLLPGPQGYRKNALYRLQGSVERQFSHHYIRFDTAR